MSAVYTVEAVIKVKNEEEAVHTIKQFMEKTSADYRLADFEKIGIRPDSIRGLMGIFLAEDQGSFSVTNDSDDFICYDSSFNASYGWEQILLSFFLNLAPFLEDTSVFYMDADDYPTVITVKDGRGAKTL